MAEFYKSKYTGEEIESLLEKINSQNIKFRKDDSGNIIGIEINDESHQYVHISIQTKEGTTYIKSIIIDNTVYELEPYPEISITSKGDSSYLESITINGVTYEIEPFPEIPTPTEVVANNGQPTTATLNSLKVGNTNYNIVRTSYITRDGEIIGIAINNDDYMFAKPTPIEANPIGEATEVLTKIKIGNTIYSLSEPATYDTYDGSYAIADIPSEEDELQGTWLKTYATKQ